MPPGAPANGYARLIGLARTASARVALDSRGEALALGLEAGPHVVKVNVAEAAETLARPVSGDDALSAAEALAALCPLPPQLVVVTRGAEGAVAVDSAGGSWQTRSDGGGPYSVGSGDAFMAGLVVALDLRDNRPLMASVDEMGQLSLPERRYKTKSFISYPIAIGNRRFGVLNLADKIGGGVYDIHDLSIIDLVAPQIALALERAEWQQRANQFQLMSITDPLTGLHNRRYLEARLAEELSRSKRYNYPLSFMMIDIDDFKLYNDLNGHQAGDRALEITAQCLRAALRKVDVASRYGGEEFSILLPQTSLEEAGVLADRIRRKMMTTKFPHGDSQPGGMVTASIGLSSFSPALNSAEAIVRAADRALYHAKRHGKNRAYAYQGIQGTGPSGPAI